MNQLNVMPAAGNGKMMRVCQPSKKPLVPLYALNRAKRWQNYSVQTPTKPTRCYALLESLPQETASLRSLLHPHSG